MTSPGAQMLGLYIHVPFCSAICNYCNFNRGLFDSALASRYVDAVVGEIQRSAAGSDRSSADHPRMAREPPDADTIYFGGGTPSLLEAADLRRIVSACRSSFRVTSDCEITLEANPETVTEDRLAAFRESGVTRLSFGVQSFRDDELARLSRLHGAARARAAFGEARRAGFDNISLDLMMWLPGQRVVEWLASVDEAVALAPEHLSVYLLEVYPNAPLRDEMARRQWSQAPDEDAEAMYLGALDRLDGGGYEQYEISNVARPGRCSRHNLKYWLDGEWVGFGCGAHSTRSGVRAKNVSSTEEYVDRLARGRSPVSERHVLSPVQRAGDAAFMGLRLTAGVDLDVIGARYGVDLWQRCRADLEPFFEEGCLTRDGTRVRLTRRGMLLANEVMAVFV